MDLLVDFAGLNCVATKVREASLKYEKRTNGIRKDE